MTFVVPWPEVAALDRGVIDVIGLLFIVAGLDAGVHLAIWTSSRRRATDDPLGRREMPRDGPYAVVAHPMMACGLPVLLGLALVLPSPAVLITASLTVGLLARQMRPTACQS